MKWWATKLWKIVFMLSVSDTAFKYLWKQMMSLLSIQCHKVITGMQIVHYTVYICIYEDNRCFRIPINWKHGWSTHPCRIVLFVFFGLRVIQSALQVLAWFYVAFCPDLIWLQYSKLFGLCVFHQEINQAKIVEHLYMVKWKCHMIY